MAIQAYSVGTSSQVNKIWRKVQGDLMDGIQYECEEYALLDELKPHKITVSAREILQPLNLNEGYGVASITEGGYEAQPGSPNAEEATLTWININARFSASMTSMFLDKLNPDAEIERELMFRGGHKIFDVARDFSDRFYGVSTGVMCQTSTVATQASGAYTLKNLYGNTLWAGSTTVEKNLIVDKFRVGDRVALVRSSALVTNAFGTITAISASTPSLTITWGGSVTSANNDNIVKANSVGNGTSATVLDDTDWNKSLVGLVDLYGTASIHSLSSASVANWDNAYTDTTAGRFSGLKLHRAKQEVQNKGPGKVNTVIYSQGVERDLFALQSAALRFNDPFALELDGQAKSKGITFFTSRRVPSAFAAPFDKSSLRKILVRPKPAGQMQWADGYKLQDQNAMIFSMDWPLALICTARRNFTFFTSQTES